MFSNPLNFILIVVLVALGHPTVCKAQFFRPHPGPFASGLSGARSRATERQLQLGRLGLSRGVVQSQSVTNNNGRFPNGGSTSIASSRSGTRGLKLGGLEIGSTLTASKTNTNGAISRGLSHNLNVGRLGVGSSFSRDNLKNGFGLQRSPNGDLKLGLGLLNLDLSRNNQQQNLKALTQAQAQAQGTGSFAKSNSNTNSRSKQFGLLGFTKTQSQSKALSGSKWGQSSAQAGGTGAVRKRRSTEDTDFSSELNGAWPQFDEEAFGFPRDAREIQGVSNSQSIFPAANGPNSVIQTNVNVNTIQGSDGFVSNTATSQALAVGRGGQSANDVATANGFSGSALNGNKGVSNTKSKVGNFGSFNGAQRIVNGQSGFRAFNKRKSFTLNTQLRPQQQNQTSSSSLSTFEIINDSKEINWPKNRIQVYNHYTQRQQQPQLPQQREHRQPQQKHPHQFHLSSINSNSSTEQFAVIDENERHGRTFTFITDLINSVLQPTCIYPCTLDAYQHNRCCETAVVMPQPPPNICCPTQQWPPSLIRPPTIIIRPPNVLPPSALHPIPGVAFPIMPTQCCNFCIGFGFFGPPPCIRQTFPGGDSGRFPIFTG